MRCTATTEKKKEKNEVFYNTKCCIIIYSIVHIIYEYLRDMPVVQRKIGYVWSYLFAIAVQHSCDDEASS
jgi:hypothetical protein